MPNAPFEVDADAINALPADARDEAWARVALLKAKVEGNKLWSFRPHEGERDYKLEHGIPLDGTEGRGQVEYLEINQDGGRYIGAAVAGNRFGKTEISMVDNLVQILPPEFVPPWLDVYRRREYIGDYRCRTVAVDLRTLQRVHLPKLRKLCPPAALFKGDFSKAWNDRYSTLTFKDGCTWSFLTHDMEVDAFAGDDIDRGHFDEEPPGERGKQQFDETKVRLIDRDGDIRFTMTPLLGLSWVFYELSRDGEPRDDEECKVVRGSMLHNPHLPDKAKDRLKKDWEKEPLKLAARLEGSWTHFEGLIYDEFREATPAEGGHVTSPRPIPRRDSDSKPSVPIYCAMDPGIDHPAALSFAWVDSQDVMEVFYAEKWSNIIAADLANVYHAVCREHNFTPRWTVIDPSARNRNFETGRNVQQALTELGVPTLPGQNSHTAGFDRVKERLRTGRLLIHSDLELLLDEFRTYRWKGKRNSQTEDLAKQEPIKKNDDILDTIRYLVMSLPVKAEPERKDWDDRSPSQRAMDHALKNLGRGRTRRSRVGYRV